MMRNKSTNRFYDGDFNAGLLVCWPAGPLQDGELFLENDFITAGCNGFSIFRIGGFL
jgi:hypothetical protein